MDENIELVKRLFIAAVDFRQKMSCFLLKTSYFFQLNSDTVVFSASIVR